MTERVGGALKNRLDWMEKAQGNLMHVVEEIIAKKGDIQDDDVEVNDFLSPLTMDRVWSGQSSPQVDCLCSHRFPMTFLS